MKTSSIRRRRLALIASLALLAPLAACAEESGGTAGEGGGGSGVELGADKQTYIDALADMEPVTLTMQSTAPKGAATGRRFEAYAEAVEEWSGGKISFEMVFSNGLAPVAEVDDALNDGRLDIGSVIVALEPNEFPLNNALWDVSFIGSQEPVQGLLQWHGAMIEAAVASDAVQQEFEDKGIRPLLPTFGSGSYFLDCADPASDLGDLKGRNIASQSRVQNAQAEALGMAPSTVSYAEMYESLQRGVVDCAISTLTTSSLGGFIDAAPHFAYASDTGLASPGGTFAMSESRWDSLPLAAQQLLYDRMDVVLEANFGATWDNVRDGLAAIDKAGGEVISLDDDATEAIRTANEEAATEARSSDDATSLVDDLLAAEESWATRVAELGIDDVDVSYADFPEWLAAGKPDLAPYFDELAQTMSARRPS